MVPVPMALHSAVGFGLSAAGALDAGGGMNTQFGRFFAFGVMVAG